jgi:polysaccharide biosynthesis/export protein
MARLHVVALSGALITGACSSFPDSGPASGAINSGVSHNLPYALVQITPEVDQVLALNAPRLAGAFTDRRGPNEIHFGVGDVVSVTIFESGPGGLFIPTEAGVRPGNFITLPNQSVDNDGNITIPYGGAIRAKGRTVVEVQRAIVDSLKSRALEPQAVVALVDQRASSISVLGDVGSSQRFPANAAGERILDAISRAGGPRSAGYDTWVMLARDGKDAVAPFEALIYEPANNIHLRPQDTIYVFRQPRTYLAFGASGVQGQIEFAAWRVSLAEGIAKAGGINDGLADPAAVFVYRGEPRRVAEQLGVDCSRFTGPIIPIIFRLNLRDPSGYFLATRFELNNKDVVLVSNAFSVEASKVLTYIRLLVGTANDPITAANSAYTLKYLIQLTNAGVVSSSAAAVAVPSDIRLKRDVELLKRLDSGLGLYRYRYLWSDTVYVGVMAQEVQKLDPDAVLRGSDGFLRVKYDRLGLRLLTWDEWVSLPAH